MIFTDTKMLFFGLSIIYVLIMTATLCLFAEPRLFYFFSELCFTPIWHTFLLSYHCFLSFKLKICVSKAYLDAFEISMVGLFLEDNY